MVLHPWFAPFIISGRRRQEGHQQHHHDRQGLISEEEGVKTEEATTAAYRKHNRINKRKRRKTLIVLVISSVVLLLFYGVWGVNYDLYLVSASSGGEGSPSSTSSAPITTKNDIKINKKLQKNNNKQQQQTSTCVEKIELLNSNYSSILHNHPAIQCLQQTSPNINLTYPLDALDHFLYIHETLKEYLQGSAIHKYHSYANYIGPRIENYWITEFYEQHISFIRNSTICLTDIYGPFIPLFIPWIDLFAIEATIYNSVIEKLVTKILRNDVPYITVSQNDEGLRIKIGSKIGLENVMPNLLVLSAGGYGHVPIPLINQLESPLLLSSKTLQQGNGDDNNNYNNTTNNYHSVKRIPISNRSTMINYVGKLINAPHDLRHRMDDVMNMLNNETTTTTTNTTIPSYNITTTKNNNNSSNPIITRFFNNRSQQQQQQSIIHPTKVYEYAYGNHWRNVMANSLFSLVPRGYGRTAFHLMETLQMGLIPIQVYSDVPWVPYSNLLLNNNDSDDDIGPLAYITNVENLQSLIEDQLLPLLLLDDSMMIIERKESRILSLRKSHFEPAGIMAHIKAFMSLDSELQVKTDLVCQKLPDTSRDADS